MLSYHNDPAVKAKYIDRVRAHRRADNLIRGTGWDGHRGCAVGCTLESYEHSRYPTELEVPEELAHIEDTLFENLPKETAMDWPEQFLNAIPVGVDLVPAVRRIKVRILREVGWYAQQTERDHWGVMDAVERVITWIETSPKTPPPLIVSTLPGSSAAAAAMAARSAAMAESAARSAAWSAAMAAWVQIRDIVIEEMANS